MPIGQDQLERKVMEMLLAGDDPTLNVLREQYRVADVTKRELTGVGFFLNFAVPPGAARLAGSGSLHLGDVAAQMEGLQHGAGFILFVREGAIDFLEGFSYDEPWPPSVEGFRLSYVTVQGAEWKRKQST
jgi:hypothetical protein